MSHPLMGKPVDVELSGRAAPVHGMLIDTGPDILVIRSESRYYYVPLVHVQRLRPGESEETDDAPGEPPFEPQSEPISYRKVLLNAKGMFSELFITGSQSIHGYVTSVMNDYFVFCSPVYHSVVISLDHLKYLVPYPPHSTPYGMSPAQFPLKPSPVSLSRTFEQQVRKLIGEFVVLDLGEHPHKIGVLKGLDDGMLAIANASGQTTYIHFNHVKTIHLP